MSFRETRPSEDRVSEEVDRACSSLRAACLDFALLSSAPNITYVSGYEVPAAIGPVVEFVGGLPLALALIDAGNATVWLVVPDAHANLLARCHGPAHAEVFGAFDPRHFEPVDVEENFRQAFRRALRGGGLSGGRAVLGVEASTLPAVVAHLLVDEFPEVRLRDATPSLEEARRVKTRREIELLRRAAQVADAGQTRLVELSTQSGASDLQVWDEVVSKMEREVGRPLIVLGELVTGSRTCEVAYPDAGGPVARQIAAGDTGILDISSRVDGYWADCANTVVFESEPTAEQRRYFTAARESFDAAAEVLRPGAKACDAEQAVRLVMERHGFPVAHYSGHQLGTSVNEKPRLVPYDTSVIEPGMVFAIEPGAYAGPDGSTGARAEKIVLVTETGSEVLSRFPWGM